MDTDSVHGQIAYHMLAFVLLSQPTWEAHQAPKMPDAIWMAIMGAVGYKTLDGSLSKWVITAICLVGPLWRVRPEGQPGEIWLQEYWQIGRNTHARRCPRLQDPRRLALEVGHHGDLPRQRRAVLPRDRQRRGHVRDEGRLEARQGDDEDARWPDALRRHLPRGAYQGQDRVGGVRLRHGRQRSGRCQVRLRRGGRPQRPQGRPARLDGPLGRPRLQGAQLDVLSE